MADSSREQQAEALIAKMKAARGYMYPEWEFAARQDPEFVEAYNRLYELSLGEGQHVSAKVREFVAIALLCFRGGERAGLVAHMRRAIQFGATPAELFEVLEACVVPGGAPTFHRGLGALMEVVGPAPRRPARVRPPAWCFPTLSPLGRGQGEGRPLLRLLHAAGG